MMTASSSSNQVRKKKKSVLLFSEGNNGMLGMLARLIRHSQYIVIKRRKTVSNDREVIPGVLPYILCTITAVAGLVLPFSELLAQGIPKLAKNFEVMALHLPTRAVAKRPLEGVHFDAGELHGESRTLGESLRKGKLRIESHPVAYLGEESLRAAHAALCAQEQHKYWEMRDLLFQVSLEKMEEEGKLNDQSESEEKMKKSQTQKESQNQAMSFDAIILKRLAALSGLDSISFAKCLHSERHVDEIKRINHLAYTLGVKGTPYFIFDRLTNAERRNKFQDVHEHFEGVVQQEDVRRILRLDEDED